MPAPTQLIFLPGAVGNPQFWRPVSERIPLQAERLLLGWPWFEERDDDKAQIDLQGLVEDVVARLDQPSALIAQSMGGVVACRAALAGPDLVTHLVLTATSGGIPVSDLLVEDWRPAFYKANPKAPRWLGEFREDLSDALKNLQVPTLLLWGDADPISPVLVGQRLQKLLPGSRLHVIAGAGHDLALCFANQAALLIGGHLATSTDKHQALQP